MIGMKMIIYQNLKYRLDKLSFKELIVNIRNLAPKDGEHYLGFQHVK